MGLVGVGKPPTVVGRTTVAAEAIAPVVAVVISTDRAAPIVRGIVAPFRAVFEGPGVLALRQRILLPWCCGRGRGRGCGRGCGRLPRGWRDVRTPGVARECVDFFDSINAIAESTATRGSVFGVRHCHLLSAANERFRRVQKVAPSTGRLLLGDREPVCTGCLAHDVVALAIFEGVYGLVL